MRSRIWCVVSLLSLAAVSSANSQDELDLFDGTWVSVWPKPGQHFNFNKIGGGRRQANLPFGSATITVSDGTDNSNLKISGEGFDCYYLFTEVGPGEMVWSLKRGSDNCPESAYLKKQVLASPAQGSVSTKPQQAPANSPQVSVSTNPQQAPANSPQGSVSAAAPEKVCTQTQGDHVVVGLRWDDPDGGLTLRSGPGYGENVQGVIPPTGVGIGVSGCNNNNWCQVKYGCQSGWANSRFLSPRSNVLRKVSGVSANDPQGLTVRTGPHHTFSASASIPHNAVDVIEHTCQVSPNDTSNWCLVTHKNDSGKIYSGWVSATYLTGHFVGAHLSATGHAITASDRAWNSVVDDYHLKGFTESTFRNRHGNVWNVWTAKTTGNTLIWSKTNRGVGFNCVADARPNSWASCTRYDLRSGQVKGKVSVQIVNGTVIDRPL